MFPLFLKRIINARSYAARSLPLLAAALFIVFTLVPQNYAAALPQSGVPLPPRQLEPLNQSYVTPPSVTFRWTPTEGAGQYHLIIFREDRQQDEDAIHVYVPGDETSYTTSELQPGYSYVWTVDVDVDTIGDNQDFFVFTLSSQPIPPITPSGLVASDGTSSEEIEIHWFPTYRTAYYQLQRRAPGSSQFVDLARVGQETTYVDKGLAAEQRYAYRVLACNNAGCSQPSAADEGWVGACAPIAAPRLTSPANGAEFHFSLQDPWYNLEWEPVPGARGYYVRLWDTVSGNMLINNHIDFPDTNYQEVTGQAGHLAWNVITENPVIGCPNSPVSETWTFHAIRNPPPAVPVNVRASDGLFEDRVVLTWEQPPSTSVLEGWEIFRSTQPNRQTAVRIDTLFTPGATTRYEDEEVTPDITYYYWVKACSHADGCSDFSASDSGFAGEPPPVEVDNAIYFPFIQR